MIEPGNFIAGTSLYNADVVKAQSKRMWDGMVRIHIMIHCIILNRSFEIYVE